MANQAENLLALELKAHNIDFEREYRFCAHYVGLGSGVKERLKQAGLKDWRFDFALTNYLIAVEIEGGAWIGGRHTRGAGFSEDLRKYDKAMVLGWSIYRCDVRMVNQGVAINSILNMIKLKREIKK